jgi:hypothetical protein
MYKDPVLAAYEALIKAKTSAFKTFYQGDPLVPPGSSLLPVVIMEKVNTDIAKLTNASDTHSMQIGITVIVDVRTELNANTELAPGIAQLYDLIEGRNADYTLKATSLLDILRKNVNVNGNLRTDLSTLTRADYPPMRQRSRDAWTVEGRVMFISHLTQTR